MQHKLQLCCTLEKLTESFDQAENADEWSYQKGLEGGWIPQDPTDLLYSDMCTTGNFTVAS